MARLPSTDVMGERELAVIIVFSILTTFVVAGRFWARWARRTKIAANDYLVLFALVTSWGVAIDAIVGCYMAGSGEHVQYVTPDELLVTGKIFVAFPLLWGCAVASVKLAVLSLYLVIFRSNLNFERAVHVLMGVSVCYGLAVMLTGAAICHPVSENFNPDPTGACANKLLFYFITAIINIVIDFTIFLLPIPMLWSLQMKTPRKISLSFLFGLGLLVCIISIFKTIAVKDLNNKNIAYTSAIDWIWSVLEPDFGIICACLPVMQPVWTRVNDYFSSFGGSREISQRSMRSTSKKLQDENRTMRPVEDQLYPLTDYEITLNDTRTSASRSKLDVEQSGFGDAVSDFNT